MRTNTRTQSRPQAVNCNRLHVSSRTQSLWGSVQAVYRMRLVFLLALSRHFACGEHSYADSLAQTLPRAQRNAHAMERMQGSGRVSALWEKRASGRAFIEAQTLLPQPEACSAEGCDRIELLGERLSAAAKALRVGYGAHGQWGIFDKGYNQTKTRFLNSWLCRYATRSKIIRSVSWASWPVTARCSSWRQSEALRSSHSICTTTLGHCRRVSSWNTRTSNASSSWWGCRTRLCAILGASAPEEALRRHVHRWSESHPSFGPSSTPA